jgi:hypothetical protein
MSYEEDTCHMRRRIHVTYLEKGEDSLGCRAPSQHTYMSYGEEDTCHMRRRIHVI